MWKWMKANQLLAAVIALACILAFSGVADGWSARRVAQRYFDQIKAWKVAYDRDTAASKKEYEGKIKALTVDRDAYRVKYEAARKKMAAPWVPPANPTEIEERFLKMGLRVKVR